MPGKIGSICDRNCFAYVATAGFDAVVVYGFDWPIDCDTFAPGYSTRIPVAPLWARVTSQPLWNARSEYSEPVLPSPFHGRELNWRFSFALRPEPSCAIAVCFSESKL